MVEYMIQLSMKVEIVGEDDVSWDIEDVANVLRESLTKLYPDTEDEDGAIQTRIAYVVEFIKQTSPRIISEKISSYFHQKGLRHWFYIGYTDDKGMPNKYDAALIMSPKCNPAGIIDLDHSIVAKEGEFKVYGHAKFSSLGATKHKLRKLTMPDTIKEYILKPGASSGISIQKRTSQQKDKHVIKKKARTMKKTARKSGLSKLFKIIAPGAGALLIGDKSSIDHDEQHNNNKTNDDTSTDDEGNQPKQAVF